MLESLLEYLKIKDVKYKENIKLSGLSPIRIGGFARIIILPQNIAELVDERRKGQNKNRWRNVKSFAR